MGLLALTLGIDSVGVPLVNAMTLQVNGNALTLSNALWQEMEEAAPALVAYYARRAPEATPTDWLISALHLYRHGALSGINLISKDELKLVWVDANGAVCRWI